MGIEGAAVLFLVAENESRAGVLLFAGPCECLVHNLKIIVARGVVEGLCPFLEDESTVAQFHRQGVEVVG